MAKNPGAQVPFAAVGIDERAVLRARHRVDGEVAAPQILLERHFGRGMECEAPVSRGGLALGAGERVFLVRPGMEEHREVRSHRSKLAPHHFLGSRSDDDIVAVLHREPEQLIADRAADHKDFHSAGAEAAYGSSSATNSFSSSAPSIHTPKPFAARMASHYPF